MRDRAVQDRGLQQRQRQRDLREGTGFALGFLYDVQGQAQCSGLRCRKAAAERRGEFPEIRGRGERL